MKKGTLHLWCKKDIATLIDCEVRNLESLITEETKEEIKFVKRINNTNKTKIFTLKDVHRILNDVYPFKTEQERLKMLLPNDYK